MVEATFATYMQKVAEYRSEKLTKQPYSSLHIIKAVVFLNGIVLSKVM